MTIHLIKLAVGIRDLDHLGSVQAARLRRLADGTAVIPVHTRHAPKRGDAVLGGGSLYWVVRGQVSARQRVLAIDGAVDADGKAACILGLDPALVPTVPVAHRPFQGWRYLEPAAAPPDLDAAGGEGGGLPSHLAAELRALGLL